jgi:hypothetical protein
MDGPDRAVEDGQQLAEDLFESGIGIASLLEQGPDFTFEGLTVLDVGHGRFLPRNALFSAEYYKI